MTKTKKKILGYSIMSFPMLVMYLACGHFIGFKQASMLFGGLAAFIACVSIGAKLTLED